MARSLFLFAVALIMAVMMVPPAAAAKGGSKGTKGGLKGTKGGSKGTKGGSKGSLAPSSVPSELPPSTKAPTMSVFPTKAPATSVPPTTAPTLEQWQQDALDKHNELRALHGAPPLKWSDDLHADAQRAANENQKLGSLEHIIPEGSDQGQNLAFGSPSLSGKEATELWYNEWKRYDFESGVFSEETGNFTQLVWKSSTHVGIAVSPNGQYVAANYFPAGNVLGLFQENVAPPTMSVPPTTAPAISVSPTPAPATSVPPTKAPSISAPPTTAPAISVPPTTAPATSVPPTKAPAPLPTAPPPTATLPTAPLPTATLPTAPLPTATLPTAPLPTATLPPTVAPTVPPTVAPITRADPSNLPPRPGDCECEGDFPELDAGLCYPRCPAGTRGIAFLCHHDCPPGGFTDIGVSCAKPAAYGRGVGYTLFEQGRCEADHGGGNCEQCLALFYPKCGEGFSPVGCNICSPNCPEGFRDDGAFCAKPLAIDRGVGQPLPCVKAFFEDKFACIRNSWEQTKDAFNLDSIKESFSGFSNITSAEDFGRVVADVGCPVLLQSPGAFITQLSSCITGAFTMYFGVTADIAFLGKGIITYGVATDADGNRGCFFTGCAGGGLAAGASAGISIGILFDPSICTLEGSTTGFDFDLDLIAGGGFGAQITDGDPKLSIEFVVSVGEAINLGSITRCDTVLDADLKTTCGI